MLNKGMLLASKVKNEGRVVVETVTLQIQVISVNQTDVRVIGSSRLRMIRDLQPVMARVDASILESPPPRTPKVRYDHNTLLQGRNLKGVKEIELFGRRFPIFKDYRDDMYWILDDAVPDDVEVGEIRDAKIVFYY